MITTRGKDNISDVGRQKCVIIILVYAYFQFDWKRRMSYLPMFCATSSLNALCKQMRTEETSCLFWIQNCVRAVSVSNVTWEPEDISCPFSVNCLPLWCDVISNSWILWNQKCIPMQSFICEHLFHFLYFWEIQPNWYVLSGPIICLFSYQYSSGVHNDFSRFCWFVAPQPFWYTLLASMVFFLMEKESWSKTIKCVSFNSLYILLILLDMK